MISCITVTKNRVNFLSKCINYFINQDYTNKELLIGFFKTDLTTIQYIENLPISFSASNNIKFIELEDLSTGSARNFVIKKALGKYICIWDDDDYYAPNRLTSQLDFLKNSKVLAVSLSSVLIYSTRYDEIRLGFERITGWEGSLFMDKSIFTGYEDLTVGEDTPLLNYLYDNKFLKIQFNPDIYVYILHNSNTSPQRHLENIFDYSFPLNPKKCRTVKALIGF